MNWKKPSRPVEEQLCRHGGTIRHVYDRSSEALVLLRTGRLKEAERKIEQLVNDARRWDVELSREHYGHDAQPLPVYTEVDEDGWLEVTR